MVLSLCIMLKTGAANTFKEYSQLVFLPYMKTQLQMVQRLDIVWDEYIPDSLKRTARMIRGKGIRRRVQPDTKIPGNWEGFLRLDDNKSEFFITCHNSVSLLSVLTINRLCPHSVKWYSPIYRHKTSVLFRPVTTRRPTRDYCCMHRMLPTMVIIS